MRSSRVNSSQQEPHAGLERLLGRHRENNWRQPVRAHTRVAFTHFLRHWQATDRLPWMLDAGCGTGASTRVLAAHHPGIQLVGIDQSRHRLGRGKSVSEQECLVRGRVLVTGGAWLVRAEFADFWRLCEAASCLPEKLFLFYPNPWPKARHLGRRWHGHPVFPRLARVPVEMRTNWEIYATEFAMALDLLGVEAVLERFQMASCISPFERKYHRSGHTLWRVRSRVK